MPDVELRCYRNVFSGASDAPSRTSQAFKINLRE